MIQTPCFLRQGVFFRKSGVKMIVDISYIEDTRKMAIQLNEIEKEIKYMKSKACCIGGVSYGDKVQHGKMTDRLERDIIRYVDLEESYANLICEYVERIREVNNFANNWVNEKGVFLLYYVLGKSYELIAKGMGQSERTIFRIKNDVYKSILKS